MSGKNTLSILDVASASGVSKSTVSRVINNAPDVAPEVAQSVREVMQRIGYVPPARRRGPKPKASQGIRSGNAALVLMGLTAAQVYRMPVFPTLLHAVERALVGQKMGLLIASVDPDHPEDVPPALAAGQADGLLLWGKWAGMPATFRERLRQTPAVWIMREHGDERGEFDHVFYNNPNVAAVAMRFLRDRGHRVVGFLSGTNKHSGFIQRERAFRDLCRDAGMQVKVAVGERGDDHEILNAAEANQLLDTLYQAEAPTGLFVASDAHLPALYQALERRGIRPMRDVDIISCDNEQPILSRLPVQPATIDIHMEDVGRKAVQQLLWRMQNRQEQSRVSVLIEPTLVVPKDLTGASRHDD